MAKVIIAQLNPKAEIICEEERLRPENSEVNRLLGSNQKLKELTEWIQKYSFEDGIQETIKWFEQNLDKYKIDIYNI